MQTIFKYELAPTDRQVIAIPTPARLLSVAEQRDRIVMYAMVEPGTPAGRTEVLIIRTGYPVPDNVWKFQFMGTVKLLGGALMFHVWTRPLPAEEGPPK